MYEALRAWCKAMNAGQVGFFLNGALVLAGLTFLCLLLCVWAFHQKKQKVMTGAGTGMVLTALLSWIFLTLVLIQSGNLSLYERSPSISLIYLAFCGMGVTAVMVSLLGRKDT